MSYRLREGLFLVLPLCILLSCGEKQDHVIAPPAHPLYKMYGTVKEDSTLTPYVDVQVDVIMTELYQGEFLAPRRAYTDSSGYYEANDLYRARYTVLVKDPPDTDTLYIGEAGIIKYEDKQFNILILPADTLDVPADTTLK